VLGTERHEARRIDNQLRGRSGRQGDPGETRFFVSLEDNLMRVFASDTIKNLMGRFGIPEDEPIENSMVTRALESAQTKIEGFNFDSRKHVLEYDNVLDKQRRAMYARRNAVLVGRDSEVADVLMDLAKDNQDVLQMLDAKETEIGRDNLLTVARNIVLQTLDMLWVEHLESMEYLRGSVNLRAYGQRDPLVEYRKEATILYRDMEDAFAARVFELISNLTKEGTAGANSLAVSAPAPTPRVIPINIPGMNSGAAHTHSHAHAHSTPELERNDPCPCGSGKKWKNCGLKNTEEHQQLMAAKS
jgi:preprotein translocase subunit SecA